MKSLMAMVAAGASIGVLVAEYAARAGRTYARMRGDRIVRCPETGRFAVVRVDALRAAIGTMRRHHSGDLRLADCSQRPAQVCCDERCLRDAVDPHSTTTAIAADWYGGAKCVYCGERVRDEAWIGHHAALADANGTTGEWSEIPSEQLIDALRAGRPVCWNCHIAETFRRQYPRLVTDRK